MYTTDQQLIMISIQNKKGFSCRNFCALSEPFVRSVGFFLRFPLCKVCFFVWETGTMPLPHLRESRHCCILNFTTWIPDSMYCTSFLLVELVFWIPIISGILQAQERFSLIPNCTDRNPDSFTWGWGGGGRRYILQQQRLRQTLFWEKISMSVLDEDQPWLPWLW